MSLSQHLCSCSQYVSIHGCCCLIFDLRMFLLFVAACRSCGLPHGLLDIIIQCRCRLSNLIVIVAQHSLKQCLTHILCSQVLRCDAVVRSLAFARSPFVTSVRCAVVCSSDTVDGDSSGWSFSYFAPAFLSDLALVTFLLTHPTSWLSSTFTSSQPSSTLSYSSSFLFATFPTWPISIDWPSLHLLNHLPPTYNPHLNLLLPSLILVMLHHLLPQQGTLLNKVVVVVVVGWWSWSSSWSCCSSWPWLWSSSFSFSQSLGVGCLIGIWLAEHGPLCLCAILVPDSRCSHAVFSQVRLQHNVSQPEAVL